MKQEQECKDIESLNQLLADLEQQPPEQAGMLLEHLQAARFSLTGNMPEELQLNLKMAEEWLDPLKDQGLKDRAQAFIDSHRVRG
ncbi:MAG TPA: hypothetical protein VG456_22955 [Candidatus Sulfopaludibacter sp.]|jgi:hypothetical protein|nr:hypothetical protein [Candidatus Sulfopaludibacter sp.]